MSNDENIERLKRKLQTNPVKLLQENPVTFYQYLQLVVTAKQEHPEWRIGQTYFNILDNVRPDIGNRIVNIYETTKYDPYHNDNNIPNFLAYVYSSW